MFHQGSDKVSGLISTKYSVRVTIYRFLKRSKLIIRKIQSFYYDFLVLFFSLLIFQVYRTNFRSFIKLPRVIVQVLLVIIERQIMGKREFVPYHIKGTVMSTTTQIFFAHSKLTGIDICMKLWPKRTVR